MASQLLRSGCSNFSTTPARGVWCEGQALLSNRRAADLAAQPFDFLAFIRARRHAGIKRDPRHRAGPLTNRPIEGRQRLQGEHLATLLRSNGDQVSDRRTQQLLHRVSLKAITGPIGFLRIPRHQSLPYEVVAASPPKIKSCPPG